MTTIEIMDFELTLKNFINKSELPWKVKQYVMGDICKMVDESTSAEALAQAMEREAKEDKNPKKK